MDCYEYGKKVDINRKVFDNRYNLSVDAKWLYSTLAYVKTSYVEQGKDYFIITNDRLSEVSGLKLTTLKKAKKELLETDLVQHWQMHFVDTETGKKSEKKISAYRIL